MTVGRQQVVVCLTPAQSLHMERMGECLWPTEKLSAGEVTRRLALTQLLWQRVSGGWWRWCERPSERSSEAVSLACEKKADYLRFAVCRRLLRVTHRPSSTSPVAVVSLT
jgi:hypothetical protein